VDLVEGLALEHAEAPLAQPGCATTGTPAASRCARGFVRAPRSLE
jgi:hypothetical protein